MNLYILVEGKNTEKKIYPSWLSYLLPQLKRVNFYDQVDKNSYFLISGHGYPNIIEHGIPNAIDKIHETGKYNYLVVCLDADEDTVEDRKTEVDEFIINNNIDLGKTELVTIIQNRCIETWLLGNRRMFNSIQPKESLLLDYANYYDVSTEDPEMMGSYTHKNHADFHYAYLKKIFRANNKVYTRCTRTLLFRTVNAKNSRTTSTLKNFSRLDRIL